MWLCGNIGIKLSSGAEVGWRLGWGLGALGVGGRPGWVGSCWVKESFESSELDATYRLPTFVGQGVGADVY